MIRSVAHVAFLWLGVALLDRRWRIVGPGTENRRWLQAIAEHRVNLFR